MRELRETILRQGQCVGDSIVKVDMFLNHINFLKQHIKCCKVNKC